MNGFGNGADEATEDLADREQVAATGGPNR
jgi:hypothetical protein